MLPMPGGQDKVASLLEGNLGSLRLPEAPTLPGASPIGGLACPLGQNMSPSLTTPNCGNAVCSPGGFVGSPEMTPFSSAQSKLGGLSEMDEWAWEMGSQQSVPSAWSHPSTVHSSVSKVSSAGGGLIPGLAEGQRLSSVKPTGVPISGGKIVVKLRKEVPQGYWDRLEIILVNGPSQKRLKPTGVKKGKTLCIEVPAGMKPGDYDVRLVFAEKMLHGAIPLSIGDGCDEESEDEDD